MDAVPRGFLAQGDMKQVIACRRRASVGELPSQVRAGGRVRRGRQRPESG